MRLGFAQGEEMTTHKSDTSIEAGVKKEVNDAFPKVSLPLHEAENSPEVTSPHKPKKEFRVGVIVEEHKPAQVVSKTLKGKGRLKGQHEKKGKPSPKGLRTKIKLWGLNDRALRFLLSAKRT